MIVDRLVKAERKRKLPANRVGAKLDRRDVAGSDWLPLFGHVWSSSARTQQRYAFVKHSVTGVTDWC